MTTAIAATLVLTFSVFEATFERANASYEQGDYAGAVNAYEQLIAEGVTHASVFYNLGNAYFRLGNLGAAIANYERALHLDPRNSAARHNLDFALYQTERRLPKPLPPAWEQSLLIWHFSWSPRAVSTMAVVCWIGLWTVLAARLWKPHKGLTRAAAVLALLAAAFAASTYAKWRPPLLAVTMSDRVPVRYGPGDNQTASFNLLCGDRVVVEERREGWARVRTADGLRGWIDEQALALVGPPYERPAIDSKG